METLLDCARRVLERHPRPVLPYTELHRLICLERPGPPPDPDFLLRRIRTRTDLFRCIQPWRGPWRPLTDEATPEAASYRSALAEAGLPVDVWVVARHAVGAPTGPAARIRTTVLGLSRSIDEGSCRSLTRWILLLRQERALRERIRSVASPESSTARSTTPPRSVPRPG